MNANIEETTSSIPVPALREKVRELHRAGAIPAAAWVSVGAAGRPGVFIASATRAECEALLSSTLPGWIAPERPAERAELPAPATALAAFGPLGSAIAAEIESASAAGIRAIAAAADGEIERAIMRALSTLPAEGSAKRSEMVLAALSIGEDSPKNLKTLARFCAPGRARKPVRFAGEPGASKTYAARAFGRAFFPPGSVFDIGCHAGTSQREFLGGYVPYAGGFEKVYGKLARAWKVAQDGPVLLIIDEINRLPIELNSIFCAALNRQTVDGVECYVLDTGIPNGAGGTEEIAAPSHNLSIVSTMNEGAGYNVSPDDRAETQRWVHIRCEYSESLAAEVARGALIKWSLTTDQMNQWASAFTTFLNASRDLALVHHRLASAPTIRIVSDSVALSDTPEQIPETVELLASGWHCGINRNSGATEPEHLEALRAAIKAAKFPVH